MLTENQKQYLEKISPDKKVVVKSFDKTTLVIAEELINKIKIVEPNLEVKHLGASALGISGQNDIDISVLCSKDEFNIHKENLSQIFGEPKSGISIIEWNFEEHGFSVTIYLADPKNSSTAEQINVFEILKNNLTLLKEYETLKELAAKKSYRYYQQKKYEFYNKILGLS